VDLFTELGLVIILATAIAYILYRLKQPIIIAYIITGLLLGPAIFDLIASEDLFSTFAKIGVAFLLFMVGLSLNVKHIKKVGKVATLTGVGQVVFTSLVSYGICRLLGFGHTASLYVGIALTFSSTIVVIKLLSDKGDLDKLYGRIVLGILVIQDLVAIFVLMLLSSKETGTWEFLSTSLLIGIAAIGVVYLVARYVFPRILPSIAKSQELLFLFSIGWCFVLSLGFAFFNFSIEIGALLAGISLASTPFATQVNSKVRPIRDFFVLMFFISLASHISLSDLGSIILPAIILSIFVLIGSPVLVLIIMGLLGFSKRNSFLTGVTIAQISEFSLILILLGAEKGTLGKDVLSLVTVVAFITILVSTYWIMFGPKIYPYLSRFLSVFERKELIDKMHYHDKALDYKIYLFGYNRIGYSVLRSLNKLKKDYLVIDHNPDTIVKLAEEGIHCRYGDAEDIELLAELNTERVEMVVSTIPDFDTNILIIDKIRSTNRNAVIIITANHIEDALEFYEKGADYVILPHYIGGDHASTIIENFGTDLNKFLGYKLRHIKDLRQKRHLKHHITHEDG
jgi:Kef-type K+ transport system membrane component KefB